MQPPFPQSDQPRGPGWGEVWVRLTAHAGLKRVTLRTQCSHQQQEPSHASPYTATNDMKNNYKRILEVEDFFLDADSPRSFYTNESSPIPTPQQLPRHSPPFSP